MINESRPRICFDVDLETRNRLRDKLSHGEIRSIYSELTNQLIDLLEAHDPYIVKAGILSKQVKLSQLLNLKKLEEKQ